MGQWKTPLQLAAMLCLILAAAMIFDQKSVRSSSVRPSAVRSSALRSVADQRSTDSASTLALSRPTLDRINHHLQTTEGRKELLTRSTEVENESTYRALESSDTVPDRQSLSALDSLETEDSAGSVIRSLEAQQFHGQASSSPEDRIRSLVEQERWLNRYNEKRRQEFVKTVISNAQAAGYAISIDPKDLTITSIRRSPNALPSPSQSRPTAAN